MLTGSLEEKKEQKVDEDVNGKKVEKSNETGSENASIPCMDRLREELSCAVSDSVSCSSIEMQNLVLCMLNWEYACSCYRFA